MSPIDPFTGSNAIVAAATWIDRSLVGTSASIFAVLAVAMVGISMLNGYIDVRRAGAVIIGCFVVFSASSIANALLGLAHSEGLSSQENAVVPTQLAETQRSQAQIDYDPYAGPAAPDH